MQYGTARGHNPQHCWRVCIIQIFFVTSDLSATRGIQRAHTPYSTADQLQPLLDTFSKSPMKTNQQMCSVNEAKLSQLQHTPLFVLGSLSARSPFASPLKTALVFSPDSGALSVEHRAGFAMPILCALPCQYSRARTDCLFPPCARGVHHIVVPAGDGGGAEHVSAMLVQGDGLKLSCQDGTTHLGKRTTCSRAWCFHCSMHTAQKGFDMTLPDILTT